MLRLSQYVRCEWLTLILAGVVIALAADLGMAPHGLRDLIALRVHRAQLEAVEHRLTLSNQELRDRIVRLGTDNQFIERQIRAELGYVRPGEVVYRFASANPDDPGRTH